SISFRSMAQSSRWRFWASACTRITRSAWRRSSPVWPAPTLRTDTDRGATLRSRRLPCLDQRPDPRRRERQVARVDAARAQRRRDRVGDRTADRNDAALASALGAERIVGRGKLLERDRAHHRIVGGERDHVVGERADQKLAVVVI